MNQMVSEEDKSNLKVFRSESEGDVLSMGVLLHPNMTEGILNSKQGDAF